jgi:hypothetical protein
MMIPHQTYAKAFLVVALALVLLCPTVHAREQHNLFKFDFEPGRALPLRLLARVTV